MRFIVSLEAGCLWLWFLRTGRNPFALRGAGAGLLVLLGLSLLVPVLRSKWFVCSLPIQLLGSLAIARWIAARRELTGLVSRTCVAAGGVAAIFLVSLGASQLSGGGFADYSHVFELMIAKVRHLGVLPDDPRLLPFEARLLWQGPFDTARPARLASDLAASLGLALLSLPLVALAWKRAGESRFALVGLGAGLAFAVTVLVVRNIVLCGLVFPVLAALLLSRIPSPTLRQVGAGGALLVQAALLSQFVAGFQISWYVDPGAPGPRAAEEPHKHQAEIRRLVEWIDKHPEEVPPDAAILGDFVNSTAILAHTGRSIVLQPKYETAEARRRAEDFFVTMWTGTPEEVRALLQRYDCRYLLVDRGTLLGNRYLAGLEGNAPPHGSTALSYFLHADPRVCGSVPGFRLVYQSPRWLHDLFRLYEAP